MKTCITCGMPLEGEHEKDFGFESPDGPVCAFDSKDGVIKSAEEIFDGGVKFFSSYTDGDQDLSMRVTRSNMKQLPYWQAHPFAMLDGAEATEEEFGAVMAKLM